MAPYNIDPATRRVSDGAYVDEMVAACDRISGTMRLPSVTFTKDEAEMVRQTLDLGDSQFHLDASSNRKGVYCIYYENPAMFDVYIDDFRCEDLGESNMDQFIGLAPFTDETRCQQVEQAIRKIFHEPSLAAKLGDATIVGAGFVAAGAAGAAANHIVKKVTGKSLVERGADWLAKKIKKDPPPPPPPPPLLFAPDGRSLRDAVESAASSAFAALSSALTINISPEAAEALMAEGTAVAALTVIGAFMVAAAANADKFVGVATGAFIIAPSDLGPMTPHPDAI